MPSPPQHARSRCGKGKSAWRPSRFPTPQWPVYTPGGGYGGLQFIAALSKRFPGYWIGRLIRYDTLQRAVFEDSPLVKSKRYLAGGIAVSWIIGESAMRVLVTPYGDELR